jgi:hypothetical protein
MSPIHYYCLLALLKNNGEWNQSAEHTIIFLSTKTDELPTKRRGKRTGGEKALGREEMHQKGN